MLLRWDIEKPGQVRVMPTPLPTWDGVGYVPSFALPTFRTGDPGGAGINGYTSAPINIPDPSGLLMLSNGTPFRTFLSTRHEDHAALLRWDIENPGPILMPDPLPSTEDGVGQVASTGDSPAVPEGSVEVAVNVPEPSTLLTLSSGAALVAFLASRRRRDRG
jgi:hypothetical protein